MESNYEEFFFLREPSVTVTQVGFCWIQLNQIFFPLKLQQSS